jgi:hypothetical protein
VIRKPSVRDNVVAFGEDHVIFEAQRVREAADKIEQALAALSCPLRIDLGQRADRRERLR